MAAAVRIRATTKVARMHLDDLLANAADTLACHWSDYETLSATG
jgi:hypothetical protein